MTIQSFDQAEAMEQRNEETVAANPSAQVPDQGTGGPQECHACSLGRRVARAKSRPNHCHLLHFTRRRPPQEVATGSRLRGNQQTNCRHLRLVIFRLQVLHKNDSIVILQRVYQHTQNENCQCCEGPNNLYQKWQYRDTAPTKNTTSNRKRSRTPKEPMMHDNDKTCFVLKPACLCPNSVR